MAMSESGMRAAKQARRVLWALVGAALAIVVAMTLMRRADPGGETRLTPSAEALAQLGVGVDDAPIVSSAGDAATWAALNGKPRIVFFGFTRCPEICPTTIADLDRAFQTVGPAAADVLVDFVTIDPARDDAATLKTYVASFGPRFRGITGTDADIARIAAAFRASYREAPLDGGDYTMDHTTLAYFLDARGKVVDVSTYGAPPDRLAAQVERLAKGG